MNTLTINSFSFQATYPSYTSAYLTGLLRKHGVNSTQIDINLIVWEEILSYNYLNKVYYNHEIILELDCPLCEVVNEKNFSELKQYVLNNIDAAKNIIRSSEFYNFEKFCWAQDIFTKAFTLIYHEYGTFITTHMPYWKGIGFDYSNINNIIKLSLNSKNNPLVDIYKTKVIPLIAEISPKNILVEVMFPFDIIGTLTLNILIKKYFPNINIIYPGLSFDEFNFSRIKEYIKKDQKYFFCFDKILMYRNDSGLIDLLKGSSADEDIDNLIFKNENSIVINNLNTGIAYDTSILPDYSDIDLKRYFIPDNVFIDRLSTRCFWARCSFCSINEHKGLRQLHNIENAVDRIQHFNETYGVKYFMFLDEACPIKHAYKFSKEIKERNINIFWSLRTRISSEFTKELLEELYDSGLRELWIGLEHINKDIIKAMNKTNKPEEYKGKASLILKTCSDLGIGLHFCHIFGFPSENEEHRKELMDFYLEHKEYLKKTPFFGTFNTYGIATDSPAYQNPSKYGITSMKLDNDSFTMTNISYETKWNDETSNPVNREKIAHYCDQLMKVFTSNKNMENIWYIVSDSPYEILFKTTYNFNPFLTEKNYENTVV